MSLQGMARGFVQAVNPDVANGDLYVNTGPVTGYGGKRAPGYMHYGGQSFQVQAAGYGALQRADALNIQGVKRQVYFNGALKGVERLAGVGGDILGFNGAYWLVYDVLEEWDTGGWCKVAVVQQTDPPENVVEAPA